jgi:phosphoribosylcarboxyaminoimidazole (NCAIR) mutase
MPETRHRTRPQAIVPVPARLLPGMLAAKTIVPVLRVSVASKHLQGVVHFGIVQCP